MATLINLNGITPAAPSNGINVIWQSDASSPVNVSAYINFAAIVADVSITGMLAVTGTISSGASITSSTDIISLQTSPATSGANFSSGHFELIGSYWTGSAAAADTWTIQDVLGTGTNPSSTLTFVHTGTSSNISFDFGGHVLANVGTISGVGLTVSGGGINILNAGELTFQSANNAQQFNGQSSELLILSLASTHTDTSANLLPAGAIIDSVVIYITQTISGGSTPTTIAVGDASTSNRFISTGTPLTAGSSAVGLNQIDAGASSQASAAKVRVTLDQIPGQGIVRITVFYRVFTAPTS